MVKQERAERTRRSLVRAAATHMDSCGYHGTSLTRISDTAGMSIGAVTFHFASKEQLADAVRDHGLALVRSAAQSAGRGRRPPLNRLVALTLSLARLLEQDTVVRATARLARELPGHRECWFHAWLPAVRDLAGQAEEARQLRPGVAARDAVLLTVHLVAGAEWYVRGSGGDPEEKRPAAAAQLERLWAVFLRSSPVP